MPKILEEEYTAAISEAADRLKYQIEFSQSALKNLLLVNGGAIVSLLTLVGNSRMKFDSSGIFWSFAYFCCGLFFVLAAYFAAFLSQYFFMQTTTYEAWNTQLQRRSHAEKYDVTRSHKLGNLSFACGIGFSIGGLLLFIVGAFVALDAIT